MASKSLVLTLLYYSFSDKKQDKTLLISTSSAEDTIWFSPQCPLRWGGQSWLYSCAAFGLIFLDTLYSVLVCSVKAVFTAPLLPA